jgi:hypothetical protein
MSVIHHIIKLDAGHSGTGNPRRCFVLFDENNDVLDVVDEEYRGHGAITRDYKITDTRVMSTIYTIVVGFPEYRKWLSMGKRYAK